MSRFELKAFAPVNIAWIKYMGKVAGLPTNPSLSLTLNTFGTTTSILVGDKKKELTIRWDPAGYVPSEVGRAKTENFLKNEKLWSEALSVLGFCDQWPRNEIHIRTTNNVPAGTGIATSASAYAALTLVWGALLAGDQQQEWIKKFQSHDNNFRRVLADVAAKGSGSACRSLDGPWVEWNQRISKIDGGSTHWVDSILLVETHPKEVSSSEAHERVLTSPLFKGRAERARGRLQELKSLLLQTPGSISEIRKLVLDEALDMHELFHTAQPSFGYLQPLTKEILQLFREGKNLPTEHGVVTVDAGANVHLFVPVEEQGMWRNWLSSRFPSLKVLSDGIENKGAHYLEGDW